MKVSKDIFSWITSFLTRANIFIRSFLMNIIIVLLIILSYLGMFICFLLRRPFKPAGKSIMVAVLASLRVVCKIRYVIHGSLPSDRPCILACRHESAIECFILYRHCNIAPIFKKELLKIFPLHLGGDAIPIDRSQSVAAMRRIIKETKTILHRGVNVAIFPSGTRAKNSDDNPPLQSGVALLHAATKADVVPIHIDTAGCWPKGRYLKYPGVVTITIGEPITHLPGFSKKAFMQKLERFLNPTRDSNPSHDDTKHRK